MKNFFIGTLLLVCSMCSLFCDAQDNTLWYSKPAADWEHALPVGNGRLGAMVYGGWPRETIQLNEESLWAGSKSEPDADATSTLPEIQRLLLSGRIKEASRLAEKNMRSNPLRIRSYQSFGCLYADFSNIGRMEDYCRELNLENGILSTTYRIGDVEYRREVFASAVNDVLVFRFTASKPGSLTFRFRYDREQDAVAQRVNDELLSIGGQIFDLQKTDAGPGGLHMSFAGLVRGEHKGGSMKVRSDAFYVEGADEVTFYFTAATNYDFSRMNVNSDIDPMDRCRSIIQKLDGSDYNEIRNAHVSEHSEKMNRVSFEMGGEVPKLPVDERLKLVRGGGTDLNLITLYFQ